jgi:hypothetical protein
MGTVSNMPSISLAKNVMRRAYRDILDPPPSSPEFKRHLRDAFAGRCAYCLNLLPEALNGWDMDHADPDAGNHAGNLLPACKQCNGDKKRDRGWLAFLRTELSGSVLEEQEQKIQSWFALHVRETLAHAPAVQAVVGELEEIIELFATKCGELRKLRAS